jgi:uncharacterized OB-fold protein
MITSPVRLEYRYTPGVAMSRFLRNIAEGRIVGQRCPRCSKVYVPPRSGACPRCGVPTEEEVPVADTGTVTTFCVVNVPFAGSLPLPYVAGAILLDGADIPMTYLLQEVDAADVRMGMRVRAEWAPADERTASLDASIKYFKPIDEPDVPIDQVVEALLNA